MLEDKMKKRVEEERDQMRKERLSDGERKKAWGGERKKKYISNARATVTVHICMVTIALVRLCTILHPLIWVFFFSFNQNV